MSAKSSSSKDVQVTSLYTEFATGQISRRDFMSRAAALGVAGAAVCPPALGTVRAPSGVPGATTPSSVMMATARCAPVLRCIV